MIKVLACIQADHDLRLVLLAALVCAFASSVAIVLYGRASMAARSKTSMLALAGAVAGAGIWSTHFIAMLAFRPGLPTAYSPPETLGSLAISLALAILGFRLAGLAPAGRPQLIAGPVLGAGIGLMHYAGMAGFRTQGVLHWDIAYVVASLVVGALLATVALTVATGSASAKRAGAGALLLTGAICGLHFVGMTAVSITPDPTIVVPRSSFSNAHLAIIAAGLTLLGLAIVAGLVVAAQTRRVAFRQLREAIAATPDGMAIYDADRRLVAWNAQFIEFLGCADGVVYGALQDDLVRAAYARVPASKGGEPGELAERLLQGRHADHQSEEHRSPHGRWWRAEHRRTPEGGSVSVFVDISVHKAAEQQQAELIRDLRKAKGRLREALSTAEEANRAKSSFLAHMSHELRTPLNGILGLSGALLRRVRDPESQEMISLIESSGRTLERVLSDILDLSKIEARKVTLETADFDLVHEVEVAVLPFSAKAQEKGVRLALDTGGLTELRVAGDALRVRQILSNLVSNAVKFTDQGDVTITMQVTEAAAGYEVRFDVRDTGVGFDPRHVERLFQAFEQDDASTTRRFGGTGLGLPICRGLADVLGGSLSATSTPGGGSTFTFAVPLALPAGEPLRPAAEVVHDVAPNLRVLLAEDHPTNQRVVELLLRPFGVDLVIVDNGEEALAALERQPFDLVLMDMQMPVLDGLEATRELRRREAAADKPNVPVAMLTANVTSEFVAQSLAAGANHHIPKPVTLETLVSGIETCLALAADDRPRPQAVSPGGA